MVKEKIPVRIGEVILYHPNLVLNKLRPDESITLNDAVELIDIALEITGNKDYVSILEGAFTLDVMDEAMNYVSQYQNPRWKAFAIVAHSLTERLLANYYLKFKKPARPTKVFSTFTDAKNWSKQFVKIDDL
ncbi:MAG TPA: hypothetical protein VII99_04230 [Bacteroidia bacterium]